MILHVKGRTVSDFCRYTYCAVLYIKYAFFFFFFFFYSTSRSGVLEFLLRLISNPLVGGYGAIDYRVSNQRKGSFLLPWPSAPVQPRNRITPTLIPSPFLDSLSFQRRSILFFVGWKWIRPLTSFPPSFLSFFLSFNANKRNIRKDN